MRLHDTANYFDRVSVRDAYTLVEACKGQLDLYDDVQRDGITAVRRVLSVRPGTVMPARRAVRLDGDDYLMSEKGAPDYHLGTEIRRKYILHRSDGLAEIKTILQELTNVQGTSAHAGVVWLKGSKEVDESSDLTNHNTLYFAKGEPVQVGYVTRLDTIWYVIRGVYATQSGFIAAVADQLDTPHFDTVAYNSRVYNPVTDAYATTTVNVKALRLRWQTHFEYLSPASAKFDEGDDVVMVAAAAVATPTTGDTIMLADGLRRVEAMYSVGGVWQLHVRRA